MSKPISYRMKCGCNYTFYASDAVVLYSRECVNECDQHSVSKTEKRMQAKIDQLQAENEQLRAALEEAQHLLRSTSGNWNEQAYFDADTVISAALAERRMK